jgi:hypothetical protein
MNKLVTNITAKRFDGTAELANESGKQAKPRPMPMPMPMHRGQSGLAVGLSGLSTRELLDAVDAR